MSDSTIKLNIKPTIFAFPIRVYWEDTDAGGIVYYANYLKFFERARSEWLRQLGIEQGTLLANEGCMFVVSEIKTKFHRPARIDSLLLVSVQIKQIGHASISLHQTAALKDSTHDGLLVCEGTVRLACVQQTTMRPVAIPKTIVALLP
jgi:acyl-CoA thioester hydrolase